MFATVNAIPGAIASSLKPNSVTFLSLLFEYDPIGKMKT